MRHHVADVRDLSQRNAYYPWLSTTYQALVDLIRAPADDKAQQRLDDVSAVFETAVASQSPPYVLFRGVNPSWDNEPRRPGRGSILIGSSPLGYSQWLQNALRDTVVRFQDPSERLVFINAWNEWAEGAYLEPDARYGYAYLQATRDAIEQIAREQWPSTPTATTSSGLIVVGHDAHPHGAQLLALNIIRELRQVLHLDAECLLLRNGPLLPRYARITPVHELHGIDPTGKEAIDLVY